jgi:hypothetical protein
MALAVGAVAVAEAPPTEIVLPVVTATDGALTAVPAGEGFTATCAITGGGANATAPAIGGRTVIAVPDTRTVAEGADARDADADGVTVDPVRGDGTTVLADATETEGVTVVGLPPTVYWLAPLNSRTSAIRDRLPPATAHLQ